MRPTLLLIRPEDQSRRFAAAFRARFGAQWPIVISPLIGLRGLRGLPVQPLPPGTTDLVFTSETAVSFARALPLSGLRAWCVGRLTAEAARAAGLDAETGPGDGVQLVEMIARRHPSGRFLHLRGRDAAVEVAALLAAKGIRCDEAVIYEQVALAPTAEARALLSGDEAVLLPLFSPNAARAAAATCPRASLLVAAMSPAIAAVAPPSARMVTAVRPDAGAMLDALGRLIASTERS